METQYPIINQDDQVIDYMTKKEAYNKSCMLRSVMIFIFNSSGSLLLQQRSLSKNRYPGYYCNSAAGHVEPNESYIDAANRELQEELSITTNLKYISKEIIPVGPGEFAMSTIYFGTSDDSIRIQESELEKCEFFEIDNIKEMIENNEKFTPSFIFLFNKYVNKNEA